MLARMASHLQLCSTTAMARRLRTCPLQVAAASGSGGYPGTAVPFYPFSTYPNVTMWNCWYGESVATSFWYMIGDGVSGHTQPKDKPIYWSSTL